MTKNIVDNTKNIINFVLCVMMSENIQESDYESERNVGFSR